MRLDPTSARVPALIPAVLDGFWSAPRLATLGTVRVDGTPHLVPVKAVRAGDRFWVLTRAESRKVSNVRATGHASIAEHTRTRWASVEGKAWVGEDDGLLARPGRPTSAGTGERTPGGPTACSWSRSTACCTGRDAPLGSAAMGDFEHEHDRYLEAWAVALDSGDSAGVEAWMAPGYHGWFAPTSGGHVPYDRDDGVAGMRASVASLRGSRLRAGHRTVARRGPEQAVVSYEKQIERDGAVVAVGFIVEAWLREGDRWLLCRELTEHGATVEERGAEGGT